MKKIFVRKGSVTNHTKELKRKKERKLMHKLGISSKDWEKHKERLAQKQKTKK